MGSLETDAAGIGTLAEPMRRELYLYVCSQPAAVSRDQAADAVGVAHHQAKFHLDRLESEGLLESDYARLGGRTGPGAGRPSKLYRRADRDIAVSLPGREYELAGRLMADAIARSGATGEPVIEALHGVAGDLGQRIAAASVPEGGFDGSARAALDLAVAVLAEHGYEPREEEGQVVMANCPFHALAEIQTEIVCHMNHALICGVTQALGPHAPDARLEPGDNRCCVVLSAPVERG